MPSISRSNSTTSISTIGNHEHHEHQQQEHQQQQQQQQQQQRIKPKAARLLGLPIQRVDRPQPKAPMSSQWVPDWPEPDDDHVMALLRRRPSGLALDLGRPSSISSSIDDPLTVWPREALVLQASGVPRGATNLWLRRHAWQLPLDPLFVAQWALSSTLSISYMIGVRPLAVAADSAGVTGHTSAFVSVLGYTAIFSAHALSLAASIVDPQAPEVLAQQMPRNPNYVQTWGVPVIDPATSTCRVCQCLTQPATRHCKRCNKCVAGLDHHCRWLNTCVGQRNYGLFLAAASCAFISLAFVLIHTLQLLYAAYWTPKAFDSVVIATLTPTEISPTAVMCALSVYAFVATGFLVAVGQLLTLHIRLCVAGTTTIEFIAREQSQKRGICARTNQSPMIPLARIGSSLSLPPLSPPLSPAAKAVGGSARRVARAVLSSPRRLAIQAWRLFDRLRQNTTTNKSWERDPSNFV